MRSLISITSVPRRLSQSLQQVLDSLDGLGFDIVVSIPQAYEKWGEPEIPARLFDYKNITIHRGADYGPATKLLGGLDFSRTASKQYTHIITFDDDVFYRNPTRVIHKLWLAAEMHPGEVITIGGIKVDRPPYRTKNGLFHDVPGHVDGVCGWRGVIYPLSAVAKDSDTTIFDMMTEMIPGTKHDDDAYFGIALSRMGIPIRSIPVDRDDVSVNCDGAGGSAVQEGVSKDRLDNEAEIYRHAVEMGWLPSLWSRQNQENFLMKALRRNGVTRKIVRAIQRQKIIYRLNQAIGP
jgi:hypothetical protein